MLKFNKPGDGYQLETTSSQGIATLTKLSEPFNQTELAQLGGTGLIDVNNPGQAVRATVKTDKPISDDVSFVQIGDSYSYMKKTADPHEFDFIFSAGSPGTHAADTPIIYAEGVAMLWHSMETNDTTIKFPGGEFNPSIQGFPETSDRLPFLIQIGDEINPRDRGKRRPRGGHRQQFYVYGHTGRGRYDGRESWPRTPLSEFTDGLTKPPIVEKSSAQVRVPSRSSRLLRTRSRALY